MTDFKIKTSYCRYYYPNYWVLNSNNNKHTFSNNTDRINMATTEI